MTPFSPSFVGGATTTRRLAKASFRPARDGQRGRDPGPSCGAAFQGGLPAGLGRLQAAGGSAARSSRRCRWKPLIWRHLPGACRHGLRAGRCHRLALGPPTAQARWTPTGTPKTRLRGFASRGYCDRATAVDVRKTHCRPDLPRPLQSGLLSDRPTGASPGRWPRHAALGGLGVENGQRHPPPPGGRCHGDLDGALMWASPPCSKSHTSSGQKLAGHSAPSPQIPATACSGSGEASAGAQVYVDARPAQERHEKGLNRYARTNTTPARRLKDRRDLVIMPAGPKGTRSQTCVRRP